MCRTLRFYKGGVTYNEMQLMDLPAIMVLYDYAKKEITHQQRENDKLTSQTGKRR